jgi:hypothetical protein
MDKRNNALLYLGIFVLLAGLGMVSGYIFKIRSNGMQKKVDKSVHSEANSKVEIQGNQAYFELYNNNRETDRGDNDREVNAGNTVEVKVLLAANPEKKFNLAMAVLKWDESSWEFVEDSGLLINGGKFMGRFMQGEKNRRSLMYLGLDESSYMSVEEQELVPFASVKLKAKTDDPGPVYLDSGGEDLQALHYVDTANDLNAVDQDLANQSNIALGFE